MLKNMTLRNKFIVAFLLITAVFVIAILFELSHLQKIKSLSQKIREKSTNIDAAMEMKLAVAQDLKILMEIIGAENESEIKALTREHETFLETYDTFAEAILKGKNTEEGMIYATDLEEVRAIITQNDNIHNTEFKTRFDEIISLRKQGFSGRTGNVRSNNRLSQLDHEADSIGSAMLEAIGSIEVLSKESMAAYQKALSDEIQFIILSLFVTVGIVIGISTVLVFLFIKVIVRPIVRASNFAHEIGTGNFDAAITIESNDEVGKLSQSLQQSATQLKNMIQESQLKADILDAVPSPVMAIDKDMNITVINKAGAALGGGTVDQFIGTKCFNLFRTEHCNTENCASANCMARGKTQTARTIARPQDGKVIPVMYTSGPLKDQTGKIIGAVETVTDLTKINKVQQSVKQNVQTLSAAVEELSTMANDMDARAAMIAQNSATVAAASEQMGVNMGNVSNRVSSVQENLNTVSSAASEMTSTVSDIARSAQEAQSTTSGAVQSVKSIEDRVDELGKASESIGSVIGTIVEIAEQTKLLALNATIEAARAGEAGKGFAVVAGEVKDLAKQTNDATIDIQAKIEKIASSTNLTIEEIKHISSVIKNVNEIVTTIAAAVEEQSATTNDIASNISAAATGMQEITTTVAESANASQDIAQNISSVNTDIGDIKNNASGLNDSSNSLAEVSTRLNEEVDQLDK